MADNKELKYYLTTYSQYSHNHLIAILSSNGAEYRFDVLQNEEVYSRFLVISDITIYNIVRQLIDNNDGTAISIEYGAF
jgi:hypothetical protein